MTAPNLHAVVATVLAGAGCSVLPISLCQEHLDTGRLVLLLKPEVPPLNTLFLVQRPGMADRQDVVRVRETLRHASTSWK